MSCDIYKRGNTCAERLVTLRKVCQHFWFCNLVIGYGGTFGDANGETQVDGNV